ncbi:MAG TPA: HPr family phosphocarrier protein [Candidatus Binataceae bacterium]|nr:HPr family phosphocarrier protein [Candidatus Binataceae bacterium]
MDAVEATLEIKNRLGLHLRAASALAETVRRFKSVVKIAIGENEVDARSVINLMMLGASMGTRLKLRIEGPDAQAALEAVRKLFENRFGED